MVTTVAKGRGFEGEVAEWLERELNHKLVRKNEWVEVSKAVKPFECDIHTKTTVPFWNKVQKFSIACAALGIILFLFKSDPSVSLPLLAFGVTMFIVAIQKKQQRNFHVWVECKHRKTKANREQMIKLKETVNMLRENRGAKWKPDFVYFFSATDFERDAIHFANRNSIECYRKTEGGFERVN